MQETIERLTRQKMDLMKQHSQQILLKDKNIHDLKQQQTYLENQNDRLIERLNSFQHLIISCTKKMSDLLKTIEVDDSFDDKQMLEDFQKLEISQKHNSYSIDHSFGSACDLISRDFEMHPLQACLSKLEKAWEAMIKQIKAQKRDQSLTKYLKQQLTIMEEEQRALRTQKGLLESIHNESERSRHQILDKIRKQIQSALKKQKIQFQKMSVQQLREKIESLVVGIEEFKRKANKLEEELYITKSQFADKYQHIKLQSARIKQKSQNQMVKLQKQITVLRGSSKN